MRLLISASHEGTSPRIAARLRGATAIWSGGAPPAEPFAEQFDAVAFPWPDAQTPAGLALGVQGGKPLLLVDPWRLPAQTVTRAFAMARAAGVRFVVANYERYLPSRRQIYQELAAGKLGRPGLVRIHRWWPLGTENPRLGDGLPLSLVREFDVAIWLLGARPVTAFACGGMDRDSAYLQIHLGFYGGGMALIDCDSRLPTLSGGYHALSVIGSQGAAYADDHEQTQLVFSEGRPQARFPDEGSPLLPSIVQDFVDDTPAAARLAMSHAQWQYACASADAVLQSLATRQAICIQAVSGVE